MSFPENPGFEPPESRENQEELLHLPVDLMDSEVDPETFKRTLITRRQEIVDDMNRAYEKALESFPGYDDSALPAAVVAVFSHGVGKKYENVIERDAYWSNKTGGVFYEMRDLLPKFHPYWLAVAESGFVPEVRLMGAFRGHGSVNLGAKLPG